MKHLSLLLGIVLVVAGCDDQNAKQPKNEKLFEMLEYQNWHDKKHGIKQVRRRDFEDGIHIDQLPPVQPEDCQFRERSKCAPLSGVFFPPTKGNTSAKEIVQAALEEMEP